MGTRLHIFPGIDYPNDIAVNTTGDVFVTGTNKVAVLSAKALETRMLHSMASLMVVSDSVACHALPQSQQCHQE